MQLCMCAVWCLQVRHSEPSAAVRDAARKLSSGRARPALELVGYEDEVAAAVKYAFGSAFVCQARAQTHALCGQGSF